MSATVHDRALRTKRTQSQRATEWDPLADVPSDASDGSSDDDYGLSKKASKKMGQKRRRSSLASVKQQLLPASDSPTVPIPNGGDFVRLTDLKGAAPDTVVGRRIVCWYAEADTVEEVAEADVEEAPNAGEPRRGALKAAIGVVTYLGEEGRMCVSYDGDDDCDGWWVDGLDDWDWADPQEVGPPPPAPPVAGCWRQRTATEEGGTEEAAARTPEEMLDVDKIFLARARPKAASHGQLELFVKWKGLAHVHSQWVPRSEQDVNLPRVG